MLAFLILKTVNICSTLTSKQHSQQNNRIVTHRYLWVGMMGIFVTCEMQIMIFWNLRMDV